MISLGCNTEMSVFEHACLGIFVKECSLIFHQNNWDGLLGESVSTFFILDSPILWGFYEWKISCFLWKYRDVKTCYAEHFTDNIMTTRFTMLMEWSDHLCWVCELFVRIFNQLFTGKLSVRLYGLLWLCRNIYLFLHLVLHMHPLKKFYRITYRSLQKMWKMLLKC